MERLAAASYVLIPVTITFAIVTWRDIPYVPLLIIHCFLGICASFSPSSGGPEADADGLA